MRRPITLVIHGESGVGKSYTADTSPKPHLILDAEGGSRFTPSRKVAWDPKREEPPVPDETWETCVVNVREYDDIRHAFEWLNSGKHPFRSVTIDSLSELQKRAADKIAGTQAMKMQDWGTLLRWMEGLVRSFRDLTTHPTGKPEVVTFVAATQEKGQEHSTMRPMLSGQMGNTLPYYVDAVGYLMVSMETDGQLTRHMQFAPVHGIVAKDRTGRLPAIMDNPSVPAILDAVYGEETNA